MISRQLSRAFTLVEVMVVVVIIAILAAIVVPKILQRPEQARLTATQQDIRNIQSALSLYKLDNGFYPSTSQGLQALVSQPSGSPKPNHWSGYMHKLPLDPWGNQFQYLHPGKHGSVDIWSDGPPGKSQPIGNWESQS